MSPFYLHIGPSILPRQHGRPLRLAEAMHQAHGHRYAVVYRIHGRRRVPIVADAGADEILFVPTGQRLHRGTVDWHRIYDDMKLWLTMMAVRQ